MKLYTRCPHCDTVFRVTPPQLQSSGGQVRCGRCNKVFDAFSSLSAKQPSATDKATVAKGAKEDLVPASVAADSGATSPDEQSSESVAVPPPVPARDSEDPSGNHAGSSPSVSNPVVSSASTQSEANLYEWEFRPLRPASLPWGFLCGSVLALLALAAQAAIALRNPLAQEYPESRPWLLRACEYLRCSLPLPRLDEKLHIESSGLEAINPALPSQILLTAAVRNRATLVVAYPALELTLTDDHDLAIARRVFLPQDYLSPGTDVNRGFEGGSEINVRLFLDTAELRAAGYRLYLFYP